MVERQRYVDFSDERFRAILNQHFPNEAHKIQQALIQLLGYEKAFPQRNENRFYWKYKIQGKIITIYFIMENPNDLSSKIQVKHIEISSNQ